MNILNSQNLDKFRKFCQDNKVKKIYLFGSAVTDRFDLNQSDLDFLVEFYPMNPIEYVESYFTLKEALIKLFNRSIDLVEEKAINNPYFLKQINQEKMLIYEQ